MSEERYSYHFSIAFRHKVISEIESGQITIGEAIKVYNIKSRQTIYNWLKKYGKSYLINHGRAVVKDKKDKIKELEHQKQKLESALAQAHLQNFCLESLLECVEQHYKVDVKKTFGQKASKKLSSK